MLNRVVIIAIALAASACTEQRRLYAGPQRSAADIGLLEPQSVYGDFGPKVHFTRIDERTFPGTTPFPGEAFVAELEPGAHVIEFAWSTGNFIGPRSLEPARLIFQAEPGHRYEARVRQPGPLEDSSVTGSWCGEIVDLADESVVSIVTMPAIGDDCGLPYVPLLHAP